MAGSKDNLTKQLIIETKKAQQGLDQVNTKLDNTDKALGKVEKSSGKGWAKMAVGIGAAVVALKGLVSLGSKFITASNRQEDALRKVNFLFGDQANKQIELATQIQKTTRYGDEQALEMIALAKSMGATNGNIEEITKGAIGLSTALGIDVNSAVKMVTAGIEGQDYTLLNRYLPSLRLAKDETEKTAIFQKALSDGFNLAKDSANSGAGAFDQMMNKLGDLYEVIGDLLQYALTPLAKGVTWLIDLIIGDGGQVDAYDDLDIATKKVKTSTNDLQTAFDNLTTAAEKQKKAVDEYIKSLDVMGKSTASIRKETSDVLRPFIEEMTELGRIADQTGSKAMKDLEEEFYALVKAMKEAPQSDFIPYIQDVIKQMRELASPVLKNAQALSDFADMFSKSEKTIADVENELKSVNAEYENGTITLTDYLAKVESLQEQWIKLKLANVSLELRNIGDEFKKIAENASDAEQPIIDLSVSFWDLITASMEGMEGASSKLQKMVGDYADTLKEMANVGTQATNYGLQEIDNRYNTEKQKYNDMLENNLISKEEYEAKVLKLDNKAEKDKKKLKQEQKKYDIATAISNIAIGITKSFELPFPLNWIQGAAIAAAGAFQVATIAKQKFADGGVLKGKRHSQGGIKLWGGQEVEGGEMVMPVSTTNNPTSRSLMNQALIADGRKPYFNEQSNGRMSRSSGQGASSSQPIINITNKIDENGIATMVTRGQNNLTRSGQDLNSL